MKQQLIYILLTFVLLFAGCTKGDVRNVEYVISESSHYAREEIRDAMNVAVDHFKREFEGCTLLTIEYDEAKTGHLSWDWAQQYGDEEAIILLSSFDVDENGGDGGFNPGDTYHNWQWILTRSGDEAWQLQTWGYG